MSAAHTEPARINTTTESGPGPSLSTVVHVCNSLRRVFGSSTYKPPMLPSVALEIHHLSCSADIDTDKLINVLERDPMLAGHVLKVANSPAFRGRDPENSLRTAVLRLGLKNLGEVVFELALHMRVFRSADYSEAMEALRCHSTACANLCRMLAARTGQDPENAFLCGLLHDIGIAGILIVLGENTKAQSKLDPGVLDEVVRQTHEEVSGMLVQLWKLPGEVAEVVSKHHSAVLAGEAPVLSAVVALADFLSVKSGFAVDLGVGPLDAGDPSQVHSVCAKLGIPIENLPGIEAEAEAVLKSVAKTLDHTKLAHESKYEASPQIETGPPAAKTVPTKPAPASSARKQRGGFFSRLWRSLFGG
jgi:HD-like signal output (HDOD) protein